MIIAIYGIPRSGKDTFINELLNRKSNAFHVKGSELLNELSFKLFNCKFRQLDNNKQEVLRIEFTKQVKALENKYDLIVVDGHYSFPSSDGFKTVFTKSDLELYDAFFYLKRSGEEIIRNYNSDSKKDYSEYLLSKEKSEEWIEYEIRNMQNVVENNDKDFIVLDSDSASFGFVCNFHQTSSSIANDIAKDIKRTANGKNIVLADLDKTISIDDLTNDFIEHSNLNPLFPKIVFKGDYYTPYQFYRFHNYLLDSTNYNDSIQYSLDKMVLNNSLVNDLFNLKKNSCIVAITTGMVDAWQIKNNSLKLFNKIYGFTKTNKVIVTPLIKRLIAKFLSSSEKVMAIGDSIIDLGMILEANKGYLVSMKKLDKRIVSACESGKIQKTVFQPHYSTFKYNFAKEEEIKW